jgi:hypothetical protein
MEELVEMQQQFVTVLQLAELADTEEVPQMESREWMERTVLMKWQNVRSQFCDNLSINHYFSG